MITRGARLATPLLVVLLACDGDGDDAAACMDGPPSVALGRPQPFVALSDADTVELVHGPQGGYHINLGVELRGLGEDPLLELFGELDGIRLAEDVVAAAGTCVDGRVVLEDLWLIWAATPEQLDGASVRVEIRATSSEGDSVAQVVELVIDDPLR